MGNEGGAINPWSTQSERFNAEDLCWKVEGYETPFAALAELIRDWPGETPTPELDPKIRHRRLVETIAGYPEIASGRRPLDMPLHPKSTLAFNLTDFLDRIPGPEDFEWHTLKTALLHYDLKQCDHVSQKKFLHHLMKGIRKTSYARHSLAHTYPEDELHVDEIRFITVLHSQSKESIEQFWPVNDEGRLDWKTLDSDANFLDPIRVNAISTHDVYFEHEFRFGSIQTWIGDMTECIFKSDSWLHPNASHHLITGASVMLESILAKMRSYILAEHRAGSIVIDGGGRLRYLSTRTINEEAKWFKEKITKSLLFDRDHTHPFAACIRNCLNEYATNPLVFQTLKHQFALDEDKDEFPRIFTQKDGEEEFADKIKKTLTQTGFQELIGPAITAQFLPRITYSGPTVHEGGTKKYPILIDESEEKIWEFEKCVLCQCTPLPKGLVNKNSIMEILETNRPECYVCPFHALLFAIGKDAKTRLQSYPDLFMKTPSKTRKNQKEITHMIKLDGNGIGQLFNKSVRRWARPKPKRVPPRTWNRLKEKDIMNLKVEWDGEKFRRHMERYGHRKAEKSVHVRRMQPLLRTQRRSISFNINWWLSLHEALSRTKEASMVPWVMAGDDVVMVNHQQLDLKGISKLFKTFHERLADKYPNEIPMTFAGAIEERGEFSLAQMYRNVKGEEEFSADLWKWQAMKISASREESSLSSHPSDWDILGEKKRKDLDNWLKKQDEIALEVLYNNLRKERLVFTTEGDYPSLLLYRRLSEED